MVVKFYFGFKQHFHHQNFYSQYDTTTLVNFMFTFVLIFWRFTMCKIDHNFSATAGLSSVILISIPVLLYSINQGAIGIMLVNKVKQGE